MDIWKFNINNETWEPYAAQGSQPSARSEFAHARNGESIMIFGGRGNEGLLADIHMLNLRKNQWVKLDLSTDSRPTPRKAACMASVDSKLFIYGGISDTGYMNELWEFNMDTLSYSQLKSYGDVPPKFAYAKCEAKLEGSRIKFKVYLGETPGGYTNLSLHEYDYESQDWKKIINQGLSLYAASRGSSYYMKDKLIGLGGYIWGQYARNEIIFTDINTGISKVKGFLPSRYYEGDSVYFKDKIYIFGGGGTFASFPIKSQVTNQLLVVELNSDCEDQNECSFKCSAGSYEKDGKCISCPAGSYNPEPGQKSCVLCPAGSFSNISGADSPTDCLPCHEDFYNPIPGQSRCLSCPYGNSCSPGSSSLMPLLTTNDLYSIQPELYKPPSDLVYIYNRYVDYCIAFKISVIMILLLFNTRFREFICRIDIYIYNHNHFVDSTMQVKRTLLGGTFTVFLICFALMIIINQSVSYIMDNATETKALVPLVALEKEYNNFQADMIRIEYKLFGYVDKCDCKNIEINIDIVELIGSHQVPECAKEENTCFIRYSCFNCEFEQSSKVSLVILEDLSFASKIQVNITSSSSIQDSNSSVTSELMSEYNTLYRGIIPSTFYYQVTPSLYISQLNDNKEESTGYHISTLKLPEKGSMKDIDEIFSANGLRVDVILQKNDAALVTNRYLNQSLFIFLSSTAGSIVAIMGCFGFVMAKTEKWYERYRFKQCNKDINRRTRLHELFGSFKLGSDIHQNTIQHTEETCKDLKPFYKYVESILDDMSISNYDLNFDEIYIQDLQLADIKQ